MTFNQSRQFILKAVYKRRAVERKHYAKDFKVYRDPNPNAPVLLGYRGRSAFQGPYLVAIP